MRHGGGSRDGLCVCATARSGDNAQLHDWLRLQLCAGARRIALRDERRLTDDEASAALWSLQPWVDDGALLLLPRRESDAPPPAATTSRWARVLREGTGSDDAARGPEWALLASESSDEDGAGGGDRHESCASQLASDDECGWVAHVAAPSEILTSGEGADEGERESEHEGGGVRTASVSPSGLARIERGGDGLGAPAMSRALRRLRSQIDPHPSRAVEVRVGAVHFSAASRRANALPEMPQRPLSVSAGWRQAEWGSCALNATGAGGGESRAICVDEASSTAALWTVPRADGSGSAAPEAAHPWLVLPSGSEGLRVHRYDSLPLRATGTTAGDAALGVEDGFGRRAMASCDASSLAVPHPSPLREDGGGGADDGEGWARWLDSAASALSDGEGVAMLRGAISPSEARAIRELVLSQLPDEKKTTRVFANHMCQVHERVASSPGHVDGCSPLAPQMVELPLQPAVLALARRLLGPSCILHNAGLSLVTPLTMQTLHLAHAQHSPHQDQPVSSAETWGGRSPPSTHPLSLQALWLLDDFDFGSGATYFVPRSQTRTQHIDAWRAERGGATPAAQPAAHFPTRFVHGRAGDVALALGSLWHAPSTASEGTPTRLALLFEYSPRFVAPRDRYTSSFLQRHLPRAQAAAAQRWRPTHSDGDGGGAAATLFPRFDEHGASSAPAMRPSAATAGGEADGCGENSDVATVWEHPSRMREQPHCLSIRSRVALRDGGPAIPLFGLGTGSPDDQPREMAAALRAGYRLVDTGELYGNERQVAAAVQLSGVHRESLVLSSKAGAWCDGALPPDVASLVPTEYRGVRGAYPTSRGTLGRGVCIGGGAATRAALNRTLASLGTHYLDLYLLHWPLTDAAYALDDPRHAEVRREAWAELVSLKRSGLVRAIGVSNWSPRQIEQVLDLETPQVLQLELHPLLQRSAVRDFCEAHGILLQAYGHHRPELRAMPPLREAARELRLPEPAGAGLLAMRWSLQIGAAVIPRSRRLEYVEANKRVFELPPLSADALRALAHADGNQSLYGLHEVFVADLVL